MFTHVCVREGVCVRECASVHQTTHAHARTSKGAERIASLNGVHRAQEHLAPVTHERLGVWREHGVEIEESSPEMRPTH
jgi:hypothetical protein